MPADSVSLPIEPLSLQRPRAMVNYRPDDPNLCRSYDVRSKLSNPRWTQDQGLVRHSTGRDFTLESVQRDGLSCPLVFRDSTGLGLKVPPSSFSVSDVKRYVGARRKLDVIDCSTQESLSMTLQQWVKYYLTMPRQRLLNVISLEFSCTKLAAHVEAPTVIRQLDWVEGVWPRELKQAQTDPTNDMRRMMYPKVQKYCLMSVSGCYTDFHLDFGGTSVWYHLHHGEKIFIVIPPSEEHYDLFLAWQLSGQQETMFFPDLVHRCQAVHLRAGDTFIMPSGWIHAVYTPADSLVFGGNFLHSFNIPQQLRVAQMEADTKVPLKLSYPFYGAIHWYVLQQYSERLASIGISGSAPEENECREVQGDHERRETGDEGSEEVFGCDVASTCSSASSSRWLKCVSVSRLSSSGSQQETQDDDRHHRICLPLSIPLTDVLQSNLPLSERPSSSDPSTRGEDTPPSLLGGTMLGRNIPVAALAGWADESKRPPCTKPPFLSSYEKEGLLALIQQMEERQLFERDACVPQPSRLLEHLKSQLNSPLLDSVCSGGPNGLGLIYPPPSPPHPRTDHRLARKRPSRQGPAQEKRRKQSGSVGKTSCGGQELREGQRSIIASLPPSHKAEDLQSSC